ncbi:MAG: hypothetical protein QOJ99_151 [Bryobacterales bacterium]|jgi:hypothetical protein|nr:hypothetical protein [Bryobacterales bacterium]
MDEERGVPREDTQNRPAVITPIQNTEISADASRSGGAPRAESTFVLQPCCIPTQLQLSKSHLVSDALNGCKFQSLLLLNDATRTGQKVCPHHRYLRVMRLTKPSRYVCFKPFITATIHRHE